MKARQLLIPVLALTLLAGVGVADAQGRDEQWEFALGLSYQLGTDLDFDGGSTVETDNDFGFVADLAYNFNNNLAVSFGVQYAGVGYDAMVIDENGEDLGISGTYDTWTFATNVIYSFMDGQFTPYVGGGIGWTWVDTNVPNGPPTTGCWWDPWWGWVCYTSYPTKTASEFSYQALIGLRYEFNEMTFMKLSYTSQWTGFDNADGTPRFDVFGLEVGWMF